MSVLSFIVFGAAALLTVGSAFLIFAFKKILHSVIALTFTFIGASVLLLLLDQTLLALLLLLVFVGGISTYLIVAVATEKRIKSMISTPLLLVLSGFIFFFLSLQALYSVSQAGTAASVNITQVIAQAFETQYALLYFMAILLFATTIGSTLVIKKFTKLLV